jgi:hypothetical protein
MENKPSVSDNNLDVNQNSEESNPYENFPLYQLQALYNSLLLQQLNLTLSSKD